MRNQPSKKTINKKSRLLESNPGPATGSTIPVEPVQVGLRLSHVGCCPIGQRGRWGRGPLDHPGDFGKADRHQQQH